jgi:hypothetical protein
VRLSAQQVIHLKNVKTANEAWRSAKRNAVARARIVADEEIRSYQAAMDHEVRLAFEAEVPKLRIGRDGLGTSDPKTLEDSLSRTVAVAAERAAKIATDPLAERYAFDETTGVLTVTLDGQTLDAAAEAQGWASETAAQAGVTSAEFQMMTRDDGSHYIAPLSPSFIDSHSLAHPVIAWAYEAKNEAEALAWLGAKLA